MIFPHLFSITMRETLSAPFTRRKKEAQTSQYFLEGTQLMVCRYGIHPWRLAGGTAGHRVSTLRLHTASPHCEMTASDPSLSLSCRSTQEEPVPLLSDAALSLARRNSALPLHARVMVNYKNLVIPSASNIK